MARPKVLILTEHEAEVLRSVLSEKITDSKDGWELRTLLEISEKLKEILENNDG